MTTPAASVLLATRDGARHLDAALASLAAQTLSPLEFVLVDDGSRDGSGERLRAFAARQPCARVVRTNGLGLSGALATAAALAHGELLARHDDDDLSHPERLERQAAHLAAHPLIGVLGTAARIIDDAGREIGAHPVPLGQAAIRRTLRRAPPFVHGSVMMTRAAYQAAGGYRAAFRAAQDYDLWLRMPESVGLANLAQPLYAWRHHPGGVFSRARATQLVYAALARAFAEERRATGADALAALAAAPDA
ncbi:MAG TPA: glycosyltransferase, partial [Candidatus Eisenbacteria bacterium]|nr:glycosyltransferase [Candidatus Eisenbacteria bacterium]